MEGVLCGYIKIGVGEGGDLPVKVCESTGIRKGRRSVFGQGWERTAEMARQRTAHFLHMILGERESVYVFVY